MHKFFIFLFFLIVILNFNPINSYFSQDDFFHFRAELGKSVTEIPTFFTSNDFESGFYRPLSRETYNLLMYKAFGLNPLPFHIVNLLLIFLIAFLTYKLVKKTTGNKQVAVFAIIIYSISAIHAIELYYLASVQTLLAAVFMSGSINLYIEKKKFLSIILFVAALTCHDMAIILPMIILMVDFLKSEKLKRVFLNLLPFGAISLVYLVFASTLFSLPSQAVYHPIFSVKSVLNSLGWYLLWCFNLPEILSDFIGPKLMLNQNFIKWYPFYFWSVLVSFMAVITILLYIFLRFRKKILNKLFLFFLGSFIFSLAPFLFFPQHKYIYYLSFALIWFSAAVALILYRNWEYNKATRFLSIIVIILLTGISLQTIHLYKSTYWAAKRSAAAEYIVTDIKKVYPEVPSGTIFYIKNDPNYPVINAQWGSSSKQAFFILSGADALKLIYDDLSIKAYFEDIEKPVNEDDSNLKIYTPNFPH